MNAEDHVTHANAARTVVAPVRKSITVKATVEHAFQVLTEGFDTWWPRADHIGKQPMVKAVIETHAGGRCFGREADGTEYDWGRVRTWEPPNRFVLAWQISPDWQHEPDLAKASEVEIRFTPEAGGLTRVDLEHRQHRGSPSSTRRPSPAVQTIAHQIAFMAMHDTYHVGQLAYARKALGHAGVVG